MKTIIVILSIFVFSFSAMAQEADTMNSEAIKKALAYLKNIKSGEMEFTLRSKRFYQSDTGELKINQLFTKPNEMETGREYKFLINYFNSYFVYNGNAYLKDINGEKKISYPEWDDIYVKINKHNYIIPSFEQFVYRIRDQLYNANSSITEKDTIVDGRELRLVRINIPYPYRGDSSIYLYRASLYLSKSGQIPVRFHSSQVHDKMGDYYVEMTLGKYQLSETHNPRIDSLIEETIRIAASDSETDTIVSKGIVKELLPIGTSIEKIKMWELTNPERELSLGENLTLIYFWYIGCYPCLQAQPDLQKLYGRYHDQGFDIVALNVFDTAEKRIEKYISAYQPTYTLAAGDKSILSIFNISIYPTYYLVRNGKIVYGSMGYGKNIFYKDLDKAISDNLK